MAGELSQGQVENDPFELPSSVGQIIHDRDENVAYDTVQGWFSGSLVLAYAETIERAFPQDSQSYPYDPGLRTYAADRQHNIIGAFQRFACGEPSGNQLDGQRIHGGSDRYRRGGRCGRQTVCRRIPYGAGA
ncbi:MAG: hypothetical protein WCS15_10485 [Prevotella sp.]